MASAFPKQLVIILLSASWSKHTHTVAIKVAIDSFSTFSPLAFPSGIIVGAAVTKTTRTLHLFPNFCEKMTTPL